MASLGTTPSNPTAFGALRQFAQRDQAEERCELCSARLVPMHQHLLAMDSRQLLCACDACALLFSRPDAGNYRRVPRRVRWLGDFKMSAEDWLALAVPVNMAFFFYHTGLGRVAAYYPSPAGPTESQLALETWQGLVRDNPALSGLEPDVEALLVNRLNTHREYYQAPIDRCYELVGLIRLHWRGLAGGTEVWQAIEAFFAGLRQESGAPAAAGTGAGAGGA